MGVHVVLGTGPLGVATAQALEERGAAVTLVNRSGVTPVDISVPVLACDVHNVAALAELLRGAPAVYQCAQPAYTKWLTEFEPLQRDILAAARGAGVRVVIADNMYSYGLVQGTISETTAVRPNSRKGALRASLAAAALRMHTAGDVRVAIARGSDFFGPLVLGSALGDRVWEPLLLGKPAMVAGNPELLHSYTYIKDFGRALAQLGLDERGDGQVWHVPNAPATSTRALLELAEPLLGRPARLRPTGRWMMRLAGLFVPEARESVEMMYEFEHPFVVDSNAFTRTFGMSATPHAEAVASTVAWYRAHLASNRH